MNNFFLGLSNTSYKKFPMYYCNVLGDQLPDTILIENKLCIEMTISLLQVLLLNSNE